MGMSARFSVICLAISGERFSFRNKDCLIEGILRNLEHPDIRQKRFQGLTINRKKLLARLRSLPDDNWDVADLPACRRGHDQGRIEPDKGAGTGRGHVFPIDGP